MSFFLYDRSRKERKKHSTPSIVTSYQTYCAVLTLNFGTKALHRSVFLVFSYTINFRIMFDSI